MRQTSYILLFGRNFFFLFFFFLQIYNIYWGQCVSVGFASTLGGTGGDSDLETRILKHGPGWVGLFCSTSRKIFTKIYFCEEWKAAFSPPPKKIINGGKKELRKGKLQTEPKGEWDKQDFWLFRILPQKWKQEFLKAALRCKKHQTFVCLFVCLFHDDSMRLSSDRDTGTKG